MFYKLPWARLNFLQLFSGLHKLIHVLEAKTENPSGLFTLFSQEVGDDLSVSMLNILPKVSSLPSLLVVNFAKEEI